MFTDPEVLSLIRTRFVPVAVDQHIHRRQKDAEGLFFAKVLTQAGRGLEGKSQGVYLFTPAGDLLAFANVTRAAPVKALLQTGLQRFAAPDNPPDSYAQQKTASSVSVPPEHGVVVDVFTKVLGGYDPPPDGNPLYYQTAIGYDHLWVWQDEAAALVRGELHDRVKMRLARFHFVDNTRGEPPMWREDEIRRLEIRLEKGRLRGHVHLETTAGERGFIASLQGRMSVESSQLTRFDLVVKGEFWGEGTFTRRAPTGRFPLAIVFKLAENQAMTDTTIPGGARGNVARYRGNWQTSTR